MNIGDRIKQRRLELGLSVDELAEMIGKNRATVYRYENKEIEKLPVTVIQPLAEALGVPPSYLFGIDEKFDNIKPITTKKIPLLGQVACGQPIYADEDRESYIEVGTDIKADFCLIAKGDSMVGARILDGDIVFIKSQDMVANGEIAVVIIDDEATLKRVFYQDGKRIILQAENASIPALIYEGDALNEIRIIGKAIAFQSDVN